MNEQNHSTHEKVMNEYSNERVKKEAERESLGYFLEAYESLTGESIEVLEESERPDFICLRKDGCKVGIELVKVTRGNPSHILDVKLIEKQDHMSVDHALSMLEEEVMEKEKKRKESNWRLPESTILIVEITDIPLSEIRGCIKPDVLPALYATGFAEVWLVDFTGVEAYDNIQLFCIRPNEWQGYHPRGLQKPYG